MTILYIAIGVLAFLALSALIISYITYYIIFKGGRYLTDPYKFLDKDGIAPYLEMTRRNIDKMLSFPCEEVSVSAYDGALLVGSYYHVKDGGVLEIQFHGYRSMGIHDFSGGAVEAIEKGHNLLLVDQRAHGRSGGRCLSFGAHERHDVLSWVNYAIERFGSKVKILLLGISMGAETVLLSSALPLPENVKGIIADCPCASVEDIVYLVGSKQKIPMKLLMPSVRLGARLFGKFSTKDTDARVAVKRARVPILLIHGEADDFVPCYMSEEIKRENRAIIFETFPGARHGMSYLSDTKRYNEICDKFIDEVIKQ